jgi:hypothetical protein
MEKHLVRQRDAYQKQLRGKVSPVARAVTYIGLGDEKRFEALEEAYRQLCPSQDLIRRINFP